MHPSKRQTRKERLLAAAAEVFSEKGYGGAKIADVAERVGIGKGTVYGYFESKDDLFLEVFDWYLRRMEAETRPEMSSLGQNAAKRLQALTEAVILAELNNFESYTLTLEFWAATASSRHRESFRKLFAGAYAQWRGIVASIIRRGISQGDFAEGTDADDLALGIVAMWDAAVIQHWVDTETDPIKAVGTTMRAILTGISPKEEDGNEN